MNALSLPKDSATHRPKNTDLSVKNIFNVSQTNDNTGKNGRASEGETLLNVPDVVPARMLTQYAYCKRLFYLEWVSSEWQDNEHTFQGNYVHRVVDQVSGAAPDPEEETFKKAQSLKLSSEKLGLVAVVDLVEGKDDEVEPIDYKKGSAPVNLPYQSWDQDRIQLCVAGLLLRESGYKCSKGAIYYAESKTRVNVDFDQELIDLTVKTLGDLRKTASSPIAPLPLENSSKCPSCSLVGICMPDEVNYYRRESSETVRRLIPRDPSSRPVYVNVQGARVGTTKGRLQIKKEKKVIEDCRLIDVSQLCLYGNVQVSTQCLRELMKREIPVSWFSYGGWFVGMTSGLPSKHVELRRRQAGRSILGSLEISRAIVKAKILNSRTLLRRNIKNKNERVLASLKKLADDTCSADKVDQLMGIEGAAARDYFSAFPAMLQGAETLPGKAFNFEGRNRRPPLDPINCLLSFCYSLVTKDLTATAYAVGLDPFIGFFHSARFGRPALALDLAEEFRPLVADSVVINLINNGEVKPEDFIVRSAGVSLTEDGRKKVLSAYERRIDIETTHPIFNYKITYRRVFEVQARLLGAVLLGEIQSYEPFITR